MSGRAFRLARGAALVIAALGLAVIGAHSAVKRLGQFEAPEVALPPVRATTKGPLRRAGSSYVRKVGALLEVGLSGSPERIGYAHSLLLRNEMVETERVVWSLLDTHVPNPLARLVLLDVAQWGYRDLAAGFSESRVREIAAMARGFTPDPFAHHFDTFQRFVYLNALYDMALAFEQSPLLGCTTFTFTGNAAPPDNPMLARAFDFDVDDVFDDRKAVFLVREDGLIPFASVAWPGLLGVVSGMNAEGVAAVVHGARAGETKTSGEPVVHAVRRLLSRARTTEEALAELARGEPLVSHVVIVLDAAGHAAKVERIPKEAQHVRLLEGARVVTTHLEGPFADHPKNQHVRKTSTTLFRESRGQELLKTVATPVTPAGTVALLRDRRGKGGVALPPGDRRAIDAHIATHGVVFETGRRVLWVTEPPHLSGRFVAFDLKQLLGSEFEPSEEAGPRPTLPAVASSPSRSSNITP